MFLLICRKMHKVSGQHYLHFTAVVMLLTSTQTHASQRCSVIPSLRQECGWTGISRDTCEQKGCCYDETIRNAKWCFEPLYSQKVFTIAASSCEGGFRGESVYLSMEQAKCTHFGGTVLPQAQSMKNQQTISSCSLKLCPNQLSQLRFGHVIAMPGACTNGTITQVGMTMYKLNCASTGGRLLAKGNDQVGEWDWVNCFFDVCAPTRELTSTMYVVAGKGRCNSDSKVGAGLLHMQSGSCSSMGGMSDQNGGAFSHSASIWCQLDICRLGKDCIKSDLGIDYKGTRSKTVSGKTCQRWDSQVPHPHVQNTDLLPIKSLSENANYCRNPNGWVDGPWCYTTDNATIWDLCEIPLCKNAKTSFPTIQTPYSWYKFAPGMHSHPESFCRLRFGGHLALINSKHELSLLASSLKVIQLFGVLNGIHEIWIGGRTSVDANMEVSLDDYDARRKSSLPHCLILSDWSGKTNNYNHYTFSLYSQECLTYTTNFICEISNTFILDYRLEGGEPRPLLNSENACVAKCRKTGTCYAVDFNRKTKMCTFHGSKSACHPGYIDYSSVHYKLSSCDCNSYLISGQNGVEDASIISYPESTSSARSRLDTQPLPQANLTGGWMAAATSSQAWLQVTFDEKRVVYAIVTQGASGTVFWVTTYKVRYSLNASVWSTYSQDNKKEVLEGNRDANSKVISSFRPPFAALHVRILPKTYHLQIGLRFELIGCSGHLWNHALNKPSYSSSVNGNFGPHLANDGFYDKNSCSKSLPGTSQRPSYWVVDLGDVFNVKGVAISGGRESSFQQLVVRTGFVFTQTSSFDFTAFRVCREISWFVDPGATVYAWCTAVTAARYVAIILPRTLPLVICEARVFGAKANITNIAIGRPAFLSSVDHDGQASRAVDGNKGGDYRLHKTCTHSRNEMKPWWVVDLGQVYTIHRVLLTNRGDCCGDRLRNIWIGVGDTFDSNDFQPSKLTTCAHHLPAVKNGETLEVLCHDDVSGQYLAVQLLYENVLTLCEVEVYGIPLLIRTYAGNGNSSDCVFPFAYNGTMWYTCVDDTRPWCATTESYDKDQLWGYCMDVRLRNGRERSEGRIEVKRRRQWGTVCDDGWSDLNTMVLCKQLGYAGGRTVAAPFFGHGSGAIFMDEVTCNGSEAGLSLCSSTDSGDHDCSHAEDAGVQCFEHHESQARYRDVPVGYPAVDRNHQDVLTNRITVLPDEIPLWGRISQWQVYMNKRSPLAFQVWRPSGPDSYILVGENPFLPVQIGQHRIQISAEDQIQTHPGDLIGFRFWSDNPIPFDTTSRCQDAPLLSKTQRDPGKAVLGMAVKFTRKDKGKRKCKMYSLFANVIVERIDSTTDFQYGDSLYSVHKELTLHSLVAKKCKLKHDDDATALDINSLQEFLALDGFLNNLATDGMQSEFWIAGRVSDEDRFFKWGHCEPQKSGECILMKRWPKDSERYEGDRHMMYSVKCGQMKFYICEKNMSTIIKTVRPITSAIPSSTTTVKLMSSQSTKQLTTGNIITTTTIPSKSNYSPAVAAIRPKHDLHRMNSGTKTLLIVLGFFVCTVLAIAIILVYRHCRRRHRNYDLSPTNSSVQFSHLEEEKDHMDS